MLATVSYPGSYSRPPIRLSVGASTAVKVVVVVIGLIGLAMSGLFVAVAWLGGTLASNALGGIDGSSAPGDPGAGLAENAGAIGSIFTVFGFCALPFALLLGYLVLLTLRRSAWLQGTMVSMRGAFRTKRVDLSTAEVQGDTVSYRQHHTGPMANYVTVYTVPALAARDRRTGTKIKIPLRGQGLKRLPSDQLRALVDAMMSDRTPADPNYPTAAALADSMLSMAANPFPV
jgi:hypothetical protein